MGRGPRPGPSFGQAPHSRQLFQSNSANCDSFSHKTGSEKSGVDGPCAPLIRGVKNM